MNKGQETMLKCVLILARQWSPTFLALGTSFKWKTIFPWTWGEDEDGFRIIQMHHIYHALYFYYINSTHIKHKIMEADLMGNPDLDDIKTGN